MMKDEKKVMRLIKFLNPQLTQEQGMFCYTFPGWCPDYKAEAPDVPNDLIKGVGETLYAAAVDFRAKFHNQRIKGYHYKSPGNTATEKGPAEESHIFTFTEKINGVLEVSRYPNHWLAHIKGTRLIVMGKIKGSPLGTGKTPNAAISDYVEAIKGQSIVTEDKRRYRVPENIFYSE